MLKSDNNTRKKKKRKVRCFFSSGKRHNEYSRCWYITPYHYLNDRNTHTRTQRQMSPLCKSYMFCLWSVNVWNTHARTHAHTHTHTHARTHARTHAHTHTHTAEKNIESRLYRSKSCFKRFEGRDRRGAVMESERERIQDWCSVEAVTGQILFQEVWRQGGTGCGREWKGREFQIYGVEKQKAPQHSIFLRRKW